jgi:hypothetical protein
VHPVPPRRVLGEQVGVDQLAQHRAQRLRGRAVQAGEGGDADVGAGRLAQTAQYPVGRARQRAGRAVHDRAEAQGQLAGVEGVQPGPPVVQFVGERREAAGPGAGRPDHHPRRHDAQGQRQARTVRQEGVQGGRLRGEPARAQPGAQQRPRLQVAHHVQPHGVRAVGGHQPGEPPPAGDQHGAARRPGQQRRDLGGVAGVVEHDEHPAVRDEAAVQRRLAVGVGRQRTLRHAQARQERADRRDRVDRVAGRVEAAQVDVELTVRVAVLVLVGPAQRQPGLAHAARTVDGRDRHGGARAGRGPQGGGDLGQLPFPPDERRRWRRELARHRQWLRLRRRLQRLRRGQPRVGVQHALVQAAQRGAGLGAQFRGEPAADPVVVRERLGRPAAAVQRHQRLPGERLVERVLRGPGDETVDDGGVPTRPQHQLVAFAFGPAAAAVPLVAYRVEPGRVERAERLAAAQRERLLDAVQGLPVIGRGSGLPDEVVEPVQVDRERVDPDQVSGPLPLQRGAGRGERVAQAGDVAVKGIPRPARQPVAPGPLHQRVGRDRPAGHDQQDGQHAALPVVAQVDGRAVAAVRRDVPEQPEPDVAHAVSVGRSRPRIYVEVPFRRPLSATRRGVRRSRPARRMTAYAPCA